MTRGNKETVSYYTIKIGSAFIKEFKVGGVYGFADDQEPYIRNMSLSGQESDAYKWHFDSLATVGEEDDVYREKDFLDALKLLEDNGMDCKVLKTTTVTTEEQKEVSFVDGKESNRKGFSEGGFTGVSGALAILHNDFVLNKGDTEKLFQSAEKTAALLSKSVDGIAEAIQQVCKDALVTQKKEEVNDVALAILKSLKKKDIY